MSDKDLSAECFKKMDSLKSRKIYQKLRRKYPTQRFMMEMVSGIFMMHCSRRYATNETVQQFMQILVGNKDAEQFFNFLAEEMMPFLRDSKGYRECVETSRVLVHRLERFLLSEHSDFRKYPVRNVMDSLIEMGCAKRFSSKEDDEVPDVQDMISSIREQPRHNEL